MTVITGAFYLYFTEFTESFFPVYKEAEINEQI